LNETEINNILEEGLYCIGCGARIQYTNQNEAGYLPKSALLKHFSDEEHSDLLCYRCFRLRNYNEIQPVEINSSHFQTILNQISNTKSLVIYVLDLFDVEGSLIPGISRLVGNNPIILVGNKMDLLPKSVKENKIINFLNKKTRDIGIKPAEIILTRATKGDVAEQIIPKLNPYLSYKEIYVVGVTNVGKSTIINQLVKYVSNQGNVITTSRFPGTTLDKIEIPLSQENKIIDTPGIIHDWQMTHYVDVKDFKYLLPNKEIKPQTFQLNPEQTIFVGGLAQIDFDNKEKISVTAYFENNLKLHRSKTQKAQELFNNQFGKLLVPIPKEAVPYTSQKFNLKNNQDLVIAGLGWFSFNSDAMITIKVPKGVKVLVREAEI
jgi:ribosome biogenesis GTPase YqeH